MPKFAILIAAFLCSTPALEAQLPDSVIPSGYGLPTGAAVAPGQILRLFVQGVGASLTQPVFATGLPLPTTLADISIQLQEFHQDIPFLTAPVPLFAVVPFSSCAGTIFTQTPEDLNVPNHLCGSFVAITVQIPFELQFTGAGEPENTAFGIELTISEGGAAKQAFVMNVYPDQIHVITGCDDPLQTTSGHRDPTPGSVPCSGLAFHPDGTQVSIGTPAQPGEELTMYALGLGKATPAAQTGRASPPNTSVPIQLGFDFDPNARPKPTYYPPQTANLVFAGLAPGSVGLYQVNFTVPDPPAGTLPCQATANLFVGSNLTVSITGNVSYGGAAICVAVK